MKIKGNLLIFGSLLLIIFAVVIVSILNKNASPGAAADIRARAGNQNTLKYTATVASVSEAKGTINVTNLQLTDTSRSGEPQNLGDWTVFVPPNFNLSSAAPGTVIVMGLESSSMNVTSHEVTAITLTPGK